MLLKLRGQLIQRVEPVLQRDLELGILIESVQKKPVDAHIARGEVIINIVIANMSHVSGWYAAPLQRLMKDGWAWLCYTRLL